MLTSMQSVIGQEKAKQFLSRAFKRGLSHAYLFRGPAGVGKKTCAYAFATLINCLSPQEEDACGKCLSCLKYSSGNHPDFLEIKPQGSAIKINQIRELKKTLTYPPFEARYRVILVKDIHLTMRRKEATNSILKTLEEPPANTVFILTGDEAGDILPTILSRCQIIPFYPLPYTLVTRVLMEEKIKKETAATLSAITEGSLGRARSLHKDELLPLRREIVSKIMGLSPDHPDAVATIFDIAEKTANAKENLEELLDLLTIWLRDIMMIQNGLADKIMSHDLSHFLPDACRRWNFDVLMDQLSLINKARRQLLHNCNRTLVCEVLFFGLL